MILCVSHKIDEVNYLQLVEKGLQIALMQSKCYWIENQFMCTNIEL